MDARTLPHFALRLSSCLEMIGTDFTNGEKSQVAATFAATGTLQS